MIKKIPLSIYLSKENIDIAKCLDFQNESQEPKKIEIRKNSKYEAVGYTGYSIPRLPNWLPFFESLSSDDGKDTLNKFVHKSASLSAVLVIRPKNENRCLIFTFGYGKKFIDINNIEPNFGRNVTLNTVDEKNINAIRTKSYEGRPWFNEIQASLGTDLYEFDLNCEYEILQKVTASLEGELPEEFIIRDKTTNKKEELLSKKITGYESVNLTANLSPDKIPALCSWLLTKYRSKRYKTMIPNIDVFDNVRDSVLIEKLDKKLIEEMKKGNPEEFHLIMPEMVFEDVDGYTIANTIHSKIDNKMECLIAEDYLTSMKKHTENEKFGVNFLKNQIIAAHYGDSFRYKWTAYKCICWETTLGKAVFVLFGGAWISVKKDFYEKKIADLNSKITNEFPMHAYKVKKGYEEKHYNEEVSKHPNMQLFDRKLQASVIGQEIEPCDLLHNSDNYIHVKRLKKSSDLSHLFSQAVIATELFQRDEVFKNNFVNDVTKETSVDVKKNLDNRNYSICFGIIVENRKKIDAAKKIQNIPAFSIICLSRAIDIIQSRGHNIKVKIQLVPVSIDTPTVILRKPKNV
jgi:uncharacterized protein (TIGR04141 family)